MENLNDLLSLTSSDLVNITVVYHLRGKTGSSTVCASDKQKSLEMNANLQREPRRSRVRVHNSKTAAGTGDEHIFHSGIFRLEILDYLSRRYVYFGNFLVGRDKITQPFRNLQMAIYNRQYSYSPTALGREPSEHECEANAGTFARK